MGAIPSGNWSSLWSQENIALEHWVSFLFSPLFPFSWAPPLLLHIFSGETQKCTHSLCWTGVSSCFDPCFLFPERLHCCHIYFHCSYPYNYYNYPEPCALNAEFQHYIHRFNKISLLWGPHSKRGQGVKGGPKTGWL